MLSILLLFLSKLIDKKVRRSGEKRPRTFPTTANKNHILILKWDDAGQAKEVENAVCGCVGASRESL